VLSCQEKQICQESDLCINQNDFDKEITIYPNPNNGKFKAEIYSTANQSSIFKFVNLNGQVVKTESIYLNQGLNHIELDISTFQNGVVLLSIEMENGRKLLGKVVKRD
jgi:sucrose-6-phosphate hydrolase SacC (GH32 family)